MGGHRSNSVIAERDPLSSGWIVSPVALSGLAELDDALRAAIATDSDELYEIARTLVERPGKRIRPALVFLAGEFGAADPERLLSAAVGVELMHIGSLYHDDIVDRAPVRRGAAAASRIWGNAPAAVAGAHVMACAVRSLAVLSDAASELVATALFELCSGQMQEVENAYNLDQSPDEHLSIVARKTAALFDLPCRVGALVAGVPDEHTTALVKFANAVGIAFQLADDVLDLEGSGDRMGKATGSDLRQGIYGLPVLLALEDGGEPAETLGGLLTRIHFGDRERRKVVTLLRESGATERALEVAQRYRELAEAELQLLPPRPARDSLERLATTATTRDR